MKRLLAFALVVACKRDAPHVDVPAPQPTTSAPAKPTGPIGGARPVRAFRAAGVAHPAPLVLLLHGYGGDGPSQLDWFGLASIGGVHLVAPDGTLDGTGRRFWNAVSTCCDFENRAVDDVAYLLSLVDDVAARHAVDRKRVYAVGLSNGGAMALRLACEAGDRIAAVVSFAGPWADDASCAPKVPVAVRVMHGTEDRVVPFAGGSIVKGIHPNAKGTLPSARAIVDAWALRNHCSGPEELPTSFDLDVHVPGAETRVTRFSGCTAGVELWTLKGSAHVPTLGETFATETWSFLSSHHR